MALKIKICGLNTREAVEAAVAAGADMIGFVLHPRSPRYVTLQQASELAQFARGHTQIVALTVDPEISVVEEIARTLRPDWVQLHGRETASFVREVGQRSDLAKVIKAVGVETEGDFESVAAYSGIAPLVLLDAKPPQDAAYPGGHGRTFDWAILKPTSSLIMLSGGLTPENVGEAIKMSRARGLRLAGVDVSSGVESAPGSKDIPKIRKFIAAARAADAA